MDSINRLWDQVGKAWEFVISAGKVAAYAGDDILLYGLIEKIQKLIAADRPSESNALQVTGRFLSYDLYGLVMGQNDSCFRWLVNGRLSRLFRTGDIGAIYDRWFGPMDAPPSRLFKSAVTLQAIPLECSAVLLPLSLGLTRPGPTCLSRPVPVARRSRWVVRNPDRAPSAQPAGAAPSK